MRKLIRKLSDMRGISGFEYRLTDQIADMFKKYCDDVKIDSLGSVIAVKRSNKPNAPKLMIEAHCDEIGLIVTSITDEGYLTFANVGGVDERITSVNRSDCTRQRRFVGSNRHKAELLTGARKDSQIKRIGG